MPAATIERRYPKPRPADRPRGGPSRATRLLAMRGDARAVARRCARRRHFAAITRAHACELQRAAGAIGGRRAVELRTKAIRARAAATPTRSSAACAKLTARAHARLRKGSACEEPQASSAPHTRMRWQFAGGVAAGESGDAAAVRGVRASWSAGKLTPGSGSSPALPRAARRVLLAALRDEMRDECQASIEEYRREVAERFGEAVKDAVKDALVERRVAWDEEALKRHEESLALCQRQHDLERVDLLSENRRLVARVLALER